MPFIAGKSSSSKGYSGFAAVPSAPANPSVSNGCVNTTYNWVKPRDNGLDITKYEYQVSINDGAWGASVETTSLSHSINTQYNTNTYKIRVRAFNAYGWGPWSNASSNNSPWTIETDNTCTDGTCLDTTCADGSCSQTDTSCDDGTCSETETQDAATCGATCSETNPECGPDGCNRQIPCGTDSCNVCLSCGRQAQTRTSTRTRTRTRSRTRTRTRSRTRTRTRSRTRTRTRSRYINSSVGCTPQAWPSWTYSDGGSETTWNAAWVYSDGGTASTWVTDYGAWVYSDGGTASTWVNDFGAWVYTSYPEWSTITNYVYGPWENSGGCVENSAYWDDITGDAYPNCYPIPDCGPTAFTFCPVCGTNATYGTRYYAYIQGFYGGDCSGSNMRSFIVRRCENAISGIASTACEYWIDYGCLAISIDYTGFQCS